MRRRARVGWAALLAVVALLSGCAGPRNALNTSASVCFRALPAAKHVVRGRGRLVGVLRRGENEVSRRFPEATALPEGRPLCLVAYRGPYRAGELEGTPDGGQYAVVAIDSRSGKVVHVRASDHLPLRFRHRV